MTSNSIPTTVIYEPNRRKLLFSCCTCSKTRRKSITTEKQQNSVRSDEQPIDSRVNDFDTCSFADIELASSNYEQEKPSNVEATPKSIASNNHSLATTNLSAYSTPSLLKKLRDKTQILDESYRDMSLKPSDQSLSSNSLVDGYCRRNTRSHLQRRRQSTDSSRRYQRKLRRQSNENIRSESSQFNLYRDEDHILKELVRFNNDIDLILTRLDIENNDHPVEESPMIVDERQDIDQTMRTDINELYIYSLLSNDIDRVRETALRNLLRMIQESSNSDIGHTYDTITLNKLNKLPKNITWKNKRVFGVPLRIYQQRTGYILPIAIQNAFEYVRVFAGKCDGLFRKPGAKSKIDELRQQIELGNQSFEISQFNEYQPYVVADVIRQYFRELPECLIPPTITRLLCDSLKNFNEDEQFLAIRYVFLLLPDETREVLEIILRFLFDVSIRLGNTQTTYRSLARIFLPSIFQSYYNNSSSVSSKIFWKKWKKDKFDVVQQENERLLLEQCLISMIIHVDLFCRIPTNLTNELNLPTSKQMKRLDELVSDECNAEFDLKSYTAKKTEEFLQRLSNTKFKTIQTNLDNVHLSMHKSAEQQTLPIWKCSIDIPNTTVKQVQQRILEEQFVWDNQFADTHSVEQIDVDKEILQNVYNFQDLPPVRSFCEFRYYKKTASNNDSDMNSIVISSLSIDHSQNHFLPGIVGLTYDMHYYITPTLHHPDHITVIQIASVDYSGRSSHWYENIYGSLLAHNLVSLRDSLTKPQVFRV